MNQSKGSKLSQLLAQWPSGTVSDTRWLRGQGYRFDLVDRYRRGGWLVSMGRGAVARNGDKVDWTGGLYAVQTQLKLPIHVGGSSALTLQGFGQYIPLGTGWQVTLYGPPKVQPPLWLLQRKWDVALRYMTTNLFEMTSGIGMTTLDRGAYHIKVSARERAIMEVFQAVPQRQTFEGAGQLMEGMMTLRPDLVQKLLECCRSVKVKRLFMYWADHHEHPWVKKLNRNRISLGAGKRVIVSGGILDSTYRITVPKPREATSGA